jgi:hypothetical protein
MLAVYFDVSIREDGIQQSTSVNMASYTAECSMFIEVFKKYENITLQMYRRFKAPVKIMLSI